MGQTSVNEPNKVTVIVELTFKDPKAKFSSSLMFSENELKNGHGTIWETKKAFRKVLLRMLEDGWK